MSNKPLNDTQKDILQILLSNEKLFETVKEFFSTQLDEMRPVIKGETPDEVIGQSYRAYDYAQEQIKKIFDTMETYKETKEPSGLKTKHI